MVLALISPSLRHNILTVVFSDVPLSMEPQSVVNSDSTAALTTTVSTTPGPKPTSVVSTQANIVTSKTFIMSDQGTSLPTTVDDSNNSQEREESTKSHSQIALIAALLVMVLVILVLVVVVTGLICKLSGKKKKSQRKIGKRNA